MGIPKVRIFSVVFFLLCLVSVQADASGKISIHRTDTTGFPCLRVYFSIADQNGPLPGPLTLSGFHGRIGHARNISIKHISSFRDAGENVALLFAVDTSGSIKEKDLTTIKKAIRSFVRQKDEDDLVALISFNDDVIKNSDFTKDADRFLTKLDSLRNRGRITVLFKAIYQGLDMLDQPDIPPLRYLVLLSDGKDEGVGFTLDDAVAKAGKSDSYIYSLGFAGKTDIKFLDNMARLAAMTGGEYINIRENGEIAPAYHVIAQKIFNQQVLKLEADFEWDGQEHSLEIRYAEPDSDVFTGKSCFQVPKDKNFLTEGSIYTILWDKLIRISSERLCYIGGMIVLLLIFSCLIWLRRRRKRPSVRNTSEEQRGILKKQPSCVYFQEIGKAKPESEKPLKKVPAEIQPSKAGKTKPEPLKKEPADVQPSEVRKAKSESGKPLKKERPDDHSLGISLYIRR
ncbi:MAG: hypothetical protein DRI57_04445 [Deltaproteobacteria bacterium]|nr:MAG: hypothetical protein DRI57_04445 [Deltaproteobacteria bacterium]